MKSRKVMFSLALVGILGSGCGLITGLDGDHRCDSSPNMEIDIGDEVWFRWGGCRADQLKVMNNLFQTDWGIEGEIRSPVQYGVAKKKTNTLTGPDPLLPGHTYRLEVVVNPGKDSEKVYHWMFTR